MKMQQIRDGVESLWDSVPEGWDRLRQSAAGAPKSASYRRGVLKVTLPKAAAGRPLVRQIRVA